MQASRNTSSQPLTRRYLTVTPVCLACLLATGGSQVAVALPEGAKVTQGTAQITQPAGNKMEIRQGTDRASIDWNSFSIGTNESLRVLQPSSSSVLVNRVTGSDPSQIFGRLDANGRVFLTNPRGIVFGRDAQVDVGGLLATTMSITADPFNPGRYALNGGDTQPGEIVVDGQIRSSGTVAFAGPQISLNGVIDAKRIAAAAANQVQIDVDGDGLVFFNPRNDEGLQARLKVLGRLQADGGVVDLRAAARAGIADTVLNVDGIVQAKSVGAVVGQVFVDGGASGDTLVRGNIDVSGLNPGERGGRVSILGERVGLLGTAAVDARGAAGGGTVLVGGDWQGSNGVRQAAQATMESGTSIDASATQAGNGGKVVVWSDIHNVNAVTNAFGTLQAKAGPSAGNGGAIETSGHTVNTEGIRVTAAAPSGKGGLWLIDPADTTVSAGVASGYQSTLNSGTSVVNDVTGDMTVSNNVNITKSAGGDATLTLSASGSIIFGTNVTIQSTTGQLGVVVHADTNANNTGRIELGSGTTITSNGGAITLGGGVNPLVGAAGGSADNGAAAAGVTLNNATLNAGGGNISIIGKGWQGAANSGESPIGIVTTGSSGITTSGSGTITLIGTGGNTSGNNSHADGIQLAGTTITSANGAINLTGTGGTTSGNATSDAHGIILAGSTISSANGTITLTGAKGALSGGTAKLAGIRAGSGTTAIYSTGAGAISLIGNGANTSGDEGIASGATALTMGYNGATIYASPILLRADSVDLANTTIKSTGTLTVEPFTASRDIGIGGASSSNLLLPVGYFTGATQFFDGFSSITVGRSDGTGTVRVGANLTGVDHLALLNGSAITLSGSVNVGANNLTLNSAGAVTQDAGKTITAAGLELKGAGSFTLTEANTVTKIAADTGGGLNDGAISFANSGALAVDVVNTDGITRSGDVSLSAGGNITVVRGINKPNSGADRTLSLVSTGAISLSTSASDIVGAGGTKLNTLLWSNSGGATGGGITLASGASIVSNNGSITLAGGSGVPTPGASGAGNEAVGSPHGILLTQATIDAGTGALAMTGKSEASGATSGVGVRILESSVAGGNVTVTGMGSSSSTTDNNFGVAVESSAGTASSVTGSGTVAITGTGGAATGSNNHGVWLSSGGAIARIGANGTGTVTVVGNGGGSGGASNNNDGVSVSGGTVSSASGSITVTGTGSTGSGVDDVSLAPGASVQSTSGAIRLNANSLNIADSSVALTSSGSLTLAPRAAAATIGLAGGAGTLQLPASYFTDNFTAGFSSITVGRFDGSGTIVVGAALAPQDHLTLLNGDAAANITLTGAVTMAANKSLSLVSAGAVTQAAAITTSGTGGLALGGPGNFTLTQANTVGTLAASSGAGTINLVNNGNLVVGSVNGTTGITRTGSTGNVSIKTTGTLGLNEKLDAAGANLTLEATGAVTQVGTSGKAITAAGLELKGNGSFALANPENNVAKIAAATGAGALQYVDADALAVDTVNTVGIARTGDVSLKTVTDNLTLNNAVNAGTAGTVRLTAGGTIGQGASGTITGLALGANGGGDVTLTQANVITDGTATGGTVAGSSTSGDFKFQNTANTTVGSVGADGSLFAATDGITASSASKAVTVFVGGVTHALVLSKGITAHGSSGTVRLNATGDISEAAGAIVTAGSLGVVGGGNVTLTEANAASNWSGTAGSDFKFANTTATTTVGSVGADANSALFGGTTGIATATAAKDITAQVTGALTLAQDLSTTTSGTVRLNAAGNIGVSGVSAKVTTGTLGARGASVSLTNANVVSDGTAAGGVLALNASGGAVDVRNTDKTTVGTVAADGSLFASTTGATTAGGNLTLQTSGATRDLVLAQNLSAGATGTVRLTASGAIQESGSATITAAALGANAGKEVTLLNSGNAVGTVAGTASDGDFKLVNNSALSVGAVTAAGSFTGATGVTAVKAAATSNDITLKTTAGNLTLASDLAAGTTGTVRLNAVGAVSETTGTITAAAVGVRAGTGIALGTSNVVQNAGGTGTFAAASASGDVGFNNTTASATTVGIVGDDPTSAGHFASVSGITTANGNAVVVAPTQLNVNQPISTGSSVNGTGIGLQSTTIQIADTVNLTAGRVLFDGAATQLGATGVITTGALAVRGTNSLSRVSTGSTLNIALESPGSDLTFTTSGDLNVSAVADVTAGALSVTGVGGITGSTVRLQAGGNITETGIITAVNLGLNAGGQISLNQANAVSGNLAAVSGNGHVVFRNAGGYAIGSVSSQGGFTATVDGVTAGGAGKNITLETTSGTVTQSAGKNLTAAGLELKGAAAYTLTNAGNDVASFAAASGGGSDGAIRYIDANALAVSTVNSVGVTRSGDVSLRTVTGDLSLTQAASLGAASLRLQASSGNVSQSGLGTVSAGALGANASGDVTLNLGNAVTTFAATSGGGNVQFRELNGYDVGSLSADAAFLSTVDGVSAVAAGKSVTLDTSAGTVTQSAGKNLTATGLELKGAGAYTLTNAGNDVTTLAAATGAGAVRYVDANALSVGTVNSVGLTRSGDVLLRTVTGDLTLAQSANVGGSTLRLQSDAGAVTQSGGSITAGTLGVNAVNAITLGQSNAVASNFAAQSTTQDVLFRNAGGYTINTVAADGALFTRVDGVSATGTARNVTLDTSAGTVTQAADKNITATGLELKGSAAYTLTNLDVGTGAGNDVARIAVASGGAGDGAVRYVDRNAVAVDTVNTVGITRTGDVSLRSFNGDLSLTQAANVGSATLRLQAGLGATQAGVTQSGAGAITAANLGVNATGDVALNLGNSVTALAATSALGNVQFKAVNGYDIGSASADSAFLSTVDGVSATAAGKNITLDTTAGTVTQSSGKALTTSASGGLELKGAGSYALLEATNGVGRIAAASAGPSDGAIHYVASNGLVVDTVNTVGITRTGDVSLRSLAGGLTMTQAVNVGANTLRLQTSDPGLAGDISQSGAGTISAAVLGVNAAGSIALNLGNAVTTLAATAPGQVSFKAVDGYNIGSVAADGNFLSAVDGVSANGGASNVTLDTGAGTVTQSAGKNITAAGLELKGSAAYTLTNAGNNVATLAAASGGAGDGWLRYVDANALAVDTVNSVGITRTGNVTLNNQASDLKLAASVDVGTNSLRLQSQSGGVYQTAGLLTAGTLGVNARTKVTTSTANAANSIGLGQNNAVSGDFAAASAVDGNIVFKNANGYQVNGVAADGSLFTAVDGITAGASVPGAITLDTAAGTVTQAAGKNLRGTGLELKGSAAYTLTNPGNDAGSFVAASGGASDGAIRYVTANSMVVNAINATSGITRTGDVSLRSVAGFLDVDRPVSVGASTLRLQAGGGAVYQTGTGSISAGALGANASGGSVNLDLANSVTTLAATSDDYVSFKAVNGYNVGSVSADAVFTSAVNGVSTTGTAGLQIIQLDTAAGAVTQSAGADLRTNALVLKGAAAYALTNAGNDVAVLAAASGGASDGVIRYVDANALSVGAAGGTGIGGITRSGDVTLRNETGDLTLNAGVNVGASALRLQSAAGAVTQSGANITAGALGVNAANAITLGATNAVATTFAARSGTQDIRFRNGIGHAIGAVGGDGALFSAVDGVSAAAAGKLVTLDTVAGTVTQTAGHNITASGLELKGAAAYTLTNAGNDVTTLAVATGAGAVKYVDATALTVGTVNTVGITRAADVLLRTVTGDLVLAQAANVGANTLRLQSVAGAVTQSGGSITAGTLGVNAANAISLGQANAVAGDVGAQSTSQDVLFKNTRSYVINTVAADGALFSQVDGIAALGAGKVITLETTAGTVSQASGKALSTSASGGLELKGAGGFELLDAANNVGRIAAASGGAGDGAIRFVDAAGGLSVDTVNTTGITRTGDVSLRTIAGDLSLGQAVSVGANALRLQASAGTVSQNGAGTVEAAALGVRAGGDIALNLGNAVTSLAADSSGGHVQFKAVNGYQVDTVAADAALLSAVNGISATGAAKNITLETATGAVTQAAGRAITGGGLELKGNAAFTLTEATNDVARLAVAAGTGTVQYVDANALAVDTVNTAGITRGANVSLKNLTGDMALNRAVNVGAATLTLESAGAVTQAAGQAITADGLELKGAGSFTLAEATNDVARLAAAAGAGAIQYVDANALAVGTVNTAGITRSGDVSLKNLSGDLTLSQAVNVGGAQLTLESTGAVTQAAGRAITGGGLELKGNAAFTLTEATNDVARLAVAAGTGTVQYVDANALAVDTVNTAGITRSANVSLKNLTGDMALNRAVNVGAATLTLESAGAVTQAAGQAITADGLELKGAGSFTLAEATNDVARLAAGAGAGAIQYVDANALAVGTVNSVGITRSGSVSLRNLTGDLTLAQSIDVGAATLRLASAAGGVTQSGGSITTSGALGVRAQNGISLGQANAVSGSLAAHAATGDVLFKNGASYQVGAVAADGTLFAAASGVAAPAAGKAITLEQTAGAVTQAAGEAIAAAGLVLKGSGSFTLGDAANQVKQVAVARGDAAADGAVTFTNAGAFDITAVGAVDGVTRAGKVTLGNSAGTAVFEGLNTSAPLVQVNGGSITVASPTLTDGKVSVPVFSLGGDIKVNQGALTLAVNKPAAVDDGLLSTYQQSIGIAKEVVLKDALGKQIRVLADVIVQTSGSLAVAAQGRLNLVADAGGSASLMQAGNQFVGGLSAKLASVPAASASDAPARSLLRVTGKQVNVAGAGVEADMAFFNADALGTTDPAVIKSRLSYSNTLGTNIQLPALAISIGPTAFDGGGAPFGQVAVDIGRGDAAGTTAGINSGYITVLPKVGGDPTGTAALIRNKAVILLTGPETGSAGYLFFYDGAGKESAILVKYNGYAPSSPQADGALSSIASVSEAARRDRFEEAVRTENVASRLRGGVITEVGPGRPATEGSAGTQPPRSCAPVGAQLGCAAGDAGGDGKP
ncbi:filamentous hemagglutinin N-terminal domain-containing protein [Roseateles sp. DXS20W]|uniref:Filamentous hemagglutinin N-terminal domain-containing protein n=1 Tax=Pelomonas lactea TaxID=3299030 RepID=A0ABW7GSE3_9BURK